MCKSFCDDRKWKLFSIDSMFDQFIYYFIIDCIGMKSSLGYGRSVDGMYMNKFHMLSWLQARLHMYQNKTHIHTYTYALCWYGVWYTHSVISHSVRKLHSECYWREFMRACVQHDPIRMCRVRLFVIHILCRMTGNCVRSLPVVDNFIYTNVHTLSEPIRSLVTSDDNNK